MSVCHCNIGICLWISMDSTVLYMWMRKKSIVEKQKQKLNTLTDYDVE